MQLLSYVQNSLSLLLCQGLMPNSPKSRLLGVDAVCICCSTQRISLHQQLCIECIIVSLHIARYWRQSLKYKLNRWYSRMSHSCCQFIFNLRVARSLSIRSFLTICVDCSESQVTKKWLWYNTLFGYLGFIYLPCQCFGRLVFFEFCLSLRQRAVTTRVWGPLKFIQRPLPWEV